MTTIRSPPHAPNGIYTRVGAQYKVYESIWNITGPLLHIRQTRQHVDFFRPPSRITPSTRPPRSAGRRSHHAHLVGACGPRGARKDTATKHAHPLRTTRTRAAGRSSKCRRRQRARRRATKSRLRSPCMRAAALLGHGMQSGDGLRRAAALRPLPRSPGQCSCLMRLTCQRSSRRVPIVRGKG